jgi:hypothetical protein
VKKSCAIYAIQTTGELDTLALEHQGEGTLGRVYTSYTVQRVGERLVLFAYDKASQRTDTYALTDKSPWLEPIGNRLSLAGPWDCVEAFQIGNCPHLMCYQSKNGEFEFVPVSDLLESAPALKFVHPRAPFTTGLTTVAMLSSLGQVFFMGYNGENGDVNIWTLSVTATSSSKQPPLAANVAWAHQWAKGWTRFAFFTYGGENFFLKTNTWKPNVNIDHISSALATGTNEVGSYLDLKDAQKLDLVRPFYAGNGLPHFLTYIASSGVTTLNRVHGDCMGWTTVFEGRTENNAQQIVPYAIGDTTYLIFA